MPYKKQGAAESKGGLTANKELLAIPGTGNDGSKSYEDVGKKPDAKISKRLPKLQIPAEPKLKQEPLFEDNGRLASAIAELDNLITGADPLDNVIRQTAANSAVMNAERDAYIAKRDRERRRQMNNAISARAEANSKRASDKPQIKQRLGLRTL